MTALVATKFNASNVVNNLTTTASGYALDARQGNALNATRTFALTAEQEYTVGTLGEKTLYRKYLHYSGVTAAINTEVLLSSQSLPSTAAHVGSRKFHVYRRLSYIAGTLLPSGLYGVGYVGVFPVDRVYKIIKK